VTGAGFAVGAVVASVVIVGGGFAYMWYKRRTAHSGKQWRKLDGDKTVHLTGVQGDSTHDGETEM
jgi:hypothetical protein